MLSNELLFTICKNGFKVGVLEIPSNLINEYLPLLDKEINLLSLPQIYCRYTKKVLEDNPLVRIVYVD